MLQHGTHHDRTHGLMKPACDCRWEQPHPILLRLSASFSLINHLEETYIPYVYIYIYILLCFILSLVMKCFSKEFKPLPVEIDFKQSTVKQHQVEQSKSPATTSSSTTQPPQQARQVQGRWPSAPLAPGTGLCCWPSAGSHPRCNLEGSAVTSLAPCWANGWSLINGFFLVKSWVVLVKPTVLPTRIRFRWLDLVNGWIPTSWFRINQTTNQLVKSKLHQFPTAGMTLLNDPHIGVAPLEAEQNADVVNPQVRSHHYM